MRLHYLDSARALLMTLGIPFHAAMIYSAGAHFLVDSPEDSVALKVLAEAIHTFRMPAFFLIAGFFAALTRAKRDNIPWLKDRWVRLGVPLLSSLLVIVPMHIAILSSPQHIRGVNVAHLWFLVVLLVFSTGLFFAPARSLRISNRQSTAFLTVIGFAIYWAALHGVWHGNGYVVGFPLRALFEYAPFFCVGVLLFGDAELWDSATTVHWAWIVGAFVAIAVASTYRPYGVTAVIHDMAAGAAAILGSYSSIALCRKLLPNPSQATRKLVDASFTVYLIHHPIVLALGVLLLPVHWSPFAEFALISSTTLFVSLLVHWLLILSHPWLRFAFNGVLPAKRSAVAVAS